MMAHPLTAWRVRRLAAALDWVSLPMAALQSTAVGPAVRVAYLQEAGARGTADCAAGPPGARLPGSAPGRLSVLAYFVMPLVSAMPAVKPLPRGCADPLRSTPPVCAGPDALCRTCLTFASIGLAVVLPVLLSAFAYRPPAQQPQQAEAAARPHFGGLRWVRRRTAAAVAAVDAWIGRTLGANSFRCHHLLVVWWALSYSWELGKTLVQLSLRAQHQPA